MKTVKQKRIASLLEKNLSKLFNSNILDIDNNILIIDINKVYVSNDLNIAKVYISFFPDIENKTLSNFKIFYYKYYKKKLYKRIRYQIKKVPKIIFYLDKSLYNLNFLEKELSGKGEKPII